MVSPARASDPAAAPRPHRFGPTARRGVLVVASAGAVTALVLAVPSLADVRHRLASIDAGWLALVSFLRSARARASRLCFMSSSIECLRRYESGTRGTRWTPVLC